jgi:hypothetical protein
MVYVVSDLVRGSSVLALVGVYRIYCGFLVVCLAYSCNY